MGSSYYVYNKKFEYLGKSDQTLPYSDKYYLTTKKIDFDYDDVEEDDDDSWSSGSGSSRYDDVYEEPTDRLPPRHLPTTTGIPKRDAESICRKGVAYRHSFT